MCGRYRRADRTLELHFSYSLRLVSHRIGDVAVMHDDFMRALVGPDAGRYPGNSSEPLERLLMPAERRRLEIARERVRTGRRDGW